MPIQSFDSAEKCNGRIDYLGQPHRVKPTLSSSRMSFEDNGDTGFFLQRQNRQALAARLPPESRGRQRAGGSAALRAVR